MIALRAGRRRQSAATGSRSQDRRELAVGVPPAREAAASVAALACSRARAAAPSRLRPGGSRLGATASPRPRRARATRADLADCAPSNGRGRRPGRAAGLSRAHFSREFRRAFGESPARLPADPPARAGGGAAAQHRQLGRRDLPRGRPAGRRLLHDQLQTHLRDDADRVPGRLPAGLRPRRRPGLRRPRLRPPATPHVSRRQRRRRAPSIAAKPISNQGGTR